MAWQREFTRSNSFYFTKYFKGAAQMEYVKAEVLVLENTEFQANEKSVRDLSELQLLLVGGGVGEVIIG